MSILYHVNFVVICSRVRRSYLISGIFSSARDLLRASLRLHFAMDSCDNPSPPRLGRGFVLPSCLTFSAHKKPADWSLWVEHYHNRFDRFYAAAFNPCSIIACTCPRVGTFPPACFRAICSVTASLFINDFRFLTASSLVLPWTVITSPQLQVMLYVIVVTSFAITFLVAILV